MIVCGPRRGERSPRSRDRRSGSCPWATAPAGEAARRHVPRPATQPMPRKRHTSGSDSALEEIVLPPPIAWTPSRVFVVGGIGVHEKERLAVQHAMRAAGVEQLNLVK